MTTNRAREKFEKWALLPPVMNIECDGDGDYEDAQTRWMFNCFSAGFEKGAFYGAARMQEQCNIDYDKLAVYLSLFEKLIASFNSAKEEVRYYKKIASDKPNVNFIIDRLVGAENILANFRDVTRMAEALTAPLLEKNTHA